MEIKDPKIVESFEDIEIYKRDEFINKIGIAAMEEEREKNKKLGIPAAFMQNGQIYYELSDGTITKTESKSVAEVALETYHEPYPLDRDDNFLSMTAFINAYDYLERTRFFLEGVKADRYLWKWVIIGLHASLYAISIAILKHTDNRSFITKPKKRKNKKPIYECEREEVNLIGFLEAIDRCKDASIMNFNQCSPIHLSKEQEKSLEQINYLRNEFSHYLEKFWDIEIDYIKEKIRDGLNIVEKLINSDINAWHFTDQQKENIMERVSLCKNNLDNLGN